ncbi:MAG: nitrogenase component 1 [Bacillota bacterium]|nr:nitrogenase component 1 [Bacillota bacterium]
MKQTQAFLSTYTADVSGVCSALFELGGMTVMHDPSGCNSTYNTHDEPRWYDTDSLVFISGLSEIEAVMGDDRKLIDDIIDAANQLCPEFVAIAGTPIPMMVGTDMPAIAAEVEAATGIPSFAVPTNGMHSYVSGAGMALAAYADRMVYENPGEIIPGSINIIGATPLDFSVNGSVEAMKKFFEKSGRKVISTWAMGSTPEELKISGRAAVNLVVSGTGMETAELLKKKFGTPYVAGTPFGEKFGSRILSCLDAAEKTGECLNAFVKADGSVPDTVIIGESILSRSLASAIYLEYGKASRIICPIEADGGILASPDMVLSDEEDIRESLKNAKIIIADPLYKRVSPVEAVFCELPHEAYSGRCFRRSMPNLIEKI